MAKDFNSILTLQEAGILAKIEELRAESRSNRFGKKVDTKDTSLRGKTKKEIARCLTALNQIRSSK